MTTTAPCPACGSNRTAPCAKLPEFPAILFPLDRGRETVPARDLDISCCEGCAHLFQVQVDPDLSSAIYIDFYYSYPFKSDEVLTDAYRKPFEQVADLFLGPGNHSLLEIGCSDEAQMRPFLERGYRCTAIDPSTPSTTRRANFINGFYGRTLLEGRFDYIVSRFNLEHVLDLEVYFDALKSNLAPGGSVLIQVPNVEYFLDSGYLNVFAHEHPQYFCRRSLAARVERSGFDILHLSGADSCSLICCFRLGKGVDQAYDPRVILRANDIQTKNVQDWLSRRDGAIVFYGAGLTATALLYANSWNARGRDIRIVDDNPVTQGRVMPNTDILVLPPTAETIPKGATILLTLARQYHDRVAEQLRRLALDVRVFVPAGDGVRELA